MLSTVAFDKNLSEYASENKLTTWQNKYVVDIRSHLLEEATKIGCLLWHSNRSGLNLCFDGLEIKNFTDEFNLKVDAIKLVDHVKSKSHRHDLTNEELVHGLESMKGTSNNLWQMIRGHDLIDLLAFAFRKTLGSCKSQEVAQANIERGLRLAYSEDNFSETELFAQIRNCEATHAPFRIFRDLHQRVLKL